jgi:hypothetical protein
VGKALVCREEYATGEVHIRWWCLGCTCIHAIRIIPGRDRPKDEVWQYNGSEECPTFSPSVLVRCDGHPVRSRCHCFVKAGEIQYLSDCSHPMANQTVPMKPWGEVVNPQTGRAPLDNMDVDPADDGES